MKKNTATSSVQWHYLLFIILFIGAVLRIYQLSAADAYTDETLYGFRSIGLIDYTASPRQPSVWQWLQPVPAWAHLSFSDHPPLVFWLQNLSFSVFGVNTVALRLPSVVAGVVSIFLLYLVGRKLFNETVGLLSGGILAIYTYHIWISRIGLQESLVIMFMLLTVYYALRSKERGRYYVVWGAALGLSLLAKYTSAILIPISIAYFLIADKKFFALKKFWQGAGLSFLVFSPVLLYNIMLFKTRGHFDFQLSILFGQNVPEWSYKMGRELIGPLSQRLANFFPNLFSAISISSFVLFWSSSVALIFVWIKTKEKSILFVILAQALLIIWIVVLGPTYRFMVMLVPFFALGLGWSIAYVWHTGKTVKYAAALLLMLAAGYEIFFAYNTLLAKTPTGPSYLLWSPIASESKNYGFNQLDAYLKKELANKMPAFVTTTRFTFTEELKQKALARGKKEGKKPYPAMIIYDENMVAAASLWVLHRRVVYDAWPIFPSQTFIQTLKKNGNDFFKKQGVKYFYFIMPTNTVKLEPEKKQTTYGKQMEKQLIEMGIVPEEIANSKGERAFNVYKFD